MKNKELERLMAGFRQFREKYFEESQVYRSTLAVPGFAPKTLVIACSDSRVDPAIIMSANPGELFVVRNVANLVPPYKKTGGVHGVSSAIEFAVVNLKVDTVLVMGHRQCGGIRAMMLQESTEDSFVGRWMKIAAGAKKRVLASFKGADEDTLCRHAEMESIITSLENLRSFPFVAEAIGARGMTLVGTYFDLEKGEILAYDEETRKFGTVSSER